MTISSTSRYANSSVVPVTDASGTTRQTILITPPGDQAFQIQYYRWSDQDRVDTVAYRAYGSEQLWWLIAQANPEISLWIKVPSGTVIRIPQVTGA